MIPRWMGIVPPVMAVFSGIGGLLLFIGLAEKELSVIIIGSFMLLVFLMVAGVCYHVRNLIRRAEARRLGDPWRDGK